jgi:outer membrane protein insertion porin family
MKECRGGAGRRGLGGSGRVFAILAVVGGLLLAAAAELRGQVAEPSYAGFEGQNVSKVELSAQPNMELRAFRSLVTQKEGAPFSGAAIRDSATALQRTALFSQVQVQITPEAAGLRVLFILQPAAYIGMLRFPGATKVFLYTRLVQAVNIPEQSPYVKDEIPVAQKALLDFFASEGFFQATVDPEIQTDQAHGIVNLIFKVDLKKRAKIGEIRFDGLSPADSAGLRTSLKSLVAKLTGASIATGRKFTAQKMNKATQFVRARLIKGGHQAPDVRLLGPIYDAESNTAAVNFRVALGPTVSVKVEGARLWKRTVRHLLPIYEENAVDRDLVDEGKRNLISYFQSKGYYDVRVDVQMDQQAQNVNVVYQVHRGDHHNMEGIYFQGNRFFNDRDLRAHVLIRDRRLLFSRGKYSDDLMRKSVNALTAYYNNWGFSKAVVTAKEADFHPQVDVTFTIVEGPQDKVASLKILGNQKVGVKDLTLGGHPLALGVGQPYSQRSLENDRNQILAAYLNRGYLNAGMEAKVEPSPDDPHKINVSYTIQEGPQVDVASLVYLGNDKTRTDFLRKIISKNVIQGNALSEGRLLTSESDLYNLGIFDWTSVRTKRPVSNQDQEDVLVKVHEAKLNTLDYGGGLEVIPRTGNVPEGAVAIPGLPPIGLGTKFSASQKNFIGPRLTLDYQRHDIRGRAETASASVVFSRLDQRAAITYTDPYFRNTSWSTLFSVSAERTTQDPVFEARLGQASLQAEKALDAKHSKNLILRYSFQRTNLSNILIPGLVLPQDQQVRLSMLSVGYLHDTRDKPLDAHRGFFQSVNVDYTAKALGSKYDFVRYLAQEAYYRPIRGSWVWANRVQLGMAKPFSNSDVPASERFFAGGAYTLRGFAINGAGPQRAVTVCSNPADTSTCTVISVPVGGNMLFVVNSEMRFPIKAVDGLGGVLFYDGGNVYSAINFNQLIHNYTNTIGVGLRYNTPVGPIRVDVGQNLNPVPGLKSTQYFITLGQSF